MDELHAVTGAYGYSGKYIARRLLDHGHQVMTLTNSPERENPFGQRIRAVRYHFDEPDKLRKNLEGVKVLYNTYWVRFSHKDFTQAQAVRNSLTLFRAAKAAGVERIVHISITNPSRSSQLPYFRYKAHLEEALGNIGVAHAILRPAVLFGKEDVLINNITWLLRKLPVFGIFGEGHYRLQPIYVDDLAQVAVEAGVGRHNQVIEAIGPETYSYRELVELLAKAIGKQRPLISVPPTLGLLAGKALSPFLGDVVITRDEIVGLMAGLLYVDAPPAGKTPLSSWVQEHAEELGRSYSSELARRRNRQQSYEKL